MKTIVCYGDSNTWGFMPKRELPDWTKNRFAPDVRWTGVLQMLLGADYRVEEEGLNGRTTYYDDPQEPHRNGLDYIDTCMLTKMPVDVAVIMLGTNDVKEFFGAPPLMIARGVRAIAEHIQKGGYGVGGGAPKILIIAPPRLGEDLKDCWPGEEFGRFALEKDCALAAQYEKIAQELGACFLNAGEKIRADKADCVHMNAEGHAVLAELVAEKVRRMVE